MNIYSINGYFKDDKTPIIEYLVADTEDYVDDDTDNQIFYYGLSEEDLKQMVIDGDLTDYEFVITSFKFLKEYKFPDDDELEEEHKGMNLYDLADRLYEEKRDKNLEL